MDKSSQQKWELMAALYQHGTNVEKLALVLQGSWTRTEIVAAMMRYSRRAQKQKESNESERRDVPLQQWLSYIKNLHTIAGTTNKHKGRVSKDSLPKDYSPLMSKVMLYAACFEEHYQGTSKDDPNYSAIYRYLSQLLAGEEPTQLTPSSASKVLEMINRLKKIIKHKDSYEYFRSLHSQNPLNPKFETPTPDETSTEADECSQEIDGILYDKAENFGSEEELDINDPNYNLKKERILKRFADSQRKVGRSLLDIPGVNPLKFMEHTLVKPKNPTIDLLNPDKKRKHSVDTDDNISSASLSATSEDPEVIAEPSSANGIPSVSGVPLSMQLQHLVYTGPHNTLTNSNHYAPKSETSNNIR